MSEGGERTYSDSEVALVLKRAAELEQRRGSPRGEGLTLAQLEDIAREAGLDPSLVAEAALELDAGPLAHGGTLFGPPATQRRVETVPGKLNEEGLRALVELVDRRVNQEGIVTTALGTVRWTGQDRLKGTQVSVGPAGEDTRIEVVQRYRERIRRLLHLIPAPVAGVWSLPVAASLGLGGAAVAATFAGGALIGMGIGHAIWRVLAAQSEREVKRLSAELVEQARQDR
jgi:hypothetical protein